MNPDLDWSEDIQVPGSIYTFFYGVILANKSFCIQGTSGSDGSIFLSWVPDGELFPVY